MTKHQAANVEHQDYVRWLHAQPCAACGYRGGAIQAAHVGRGGTGMKHGSDAEVIPLCGPRWRSGRIVPGCHAEHDQLRGQFKIGINLSSRTAIREWDAHQVTVHRGRFEARNVDAQGDCPF